MAHWAEVENNTVLRVLVTDNDDPNGDEGYSYLVETFGGTWIQTSYNGNIRKNFASTGFFYDEQLDAFIPPKPYDSWILNEDACQWHAPVDMPQDEELYNWDEESLSWMKIEDIV